MFRGSNTMELNEATIRAALQYWFDEVIYRDGSCPDISSVKGSINGSVYKFEVTFSEPVENKEE